MSKRKETIVKRRKRKRQDKNIVDELKVDKIPTL
jgi:hypothetical protein